MTSPMDRQGVRVAHLSAHALRLGRGGLLRLSPRWRSRGRPADAQNILRVHRSALTLDPGYLRAESSRRCDCLTMSVANPNTVSTRKAALQATRISASYRLEPGGRRRCARAPGGPSSRQPSPAQNPNGERKGASPFAPSALDIPNPPARLGYLISAY